MESGTHNMSETPTILEVNAETGDEVIRELTSDEIAERGAMQTQAELLEAERQAQSAARESALAKLAALGLTQEEIEAL
jgi:hypothetical protein